MTFNYLRPMIGLPTAIQASAHTFTVMSYNVLAQHMINREYYPYTSATALKWNVRKANFTKEIAQINADIVCLQECSNYDSFWEVTLRNFGYKGYLKMRTNNKKDGCAIFFKQDKFEVVDVESLEYNDLIAADGSNKAEMQRENVALFLVLKFAGAQSEKGVVVGNTHLYWNYRYNYVRMRQAMSYLEMATTISGKYKFPFVLCGDFNLTPDSTLYHVLTCGKPEEGRLDNFTYFEEHETAHLKNDVAPPAFTPEQQKQNEIRITHVHEYLRVERPKLPLLHSTYSCYQDLVPLSAELPEPPFKGEPPFTNFTNSFKGTLDYIFTKKGETAIIPQKIMELPPLDLLQSHVALPNDTLSSDHVSIMCEFSVPE